MKAEETAFLEALIIEPDAFHDKRGYFMYMFLRSL